MFKNVHENYVHNSKKFDMSKMFINQIMGKRNCGIFIYIYWRNTAQ